MKYQFDTLIIIFLKLFRCLTLFFVGFFLNLNLLMFNYILFFSNIKT